MDFSRLTGWRESHTYSSINQSDVEMQNRSQSSSQSRSRAPGQESLNENSKYFYSQEDSYIITPKGICVLWSFFAILLFISIMFLISLNFVSYDECALEINKFGTVYESPVLTQGTYALFPIIGTVLFPATFQEVYFNSTVFSDTGLPFVLEIQYYYKLPTHDLYDIYNKFSYSYDSRVQSSSKKTIKNLAADFAVADFLQNRTFIEETFAKGIYEDLQNDIGVYAPEQYFKIINITFPPNIIDNSLNSALALQLTQIQQNQQAVDVVRADTAQMVADINAETNALLQNSVAKSNAVALLGNNKYMMIVDSTRGKGMDLVVKALGITNPPDLDEFIKYMGLLDNVNKTIFRGMDNVIVNTNGVTN